MLIVNIRRIKTGETQRFEFKSVDLPDKDSIHFSTSTDKGKFIVHWN